MLAASGGAEREALDRLRARLLASGELEGGRTMLAAFGGVEPCLLRFLRARRLDVEQAQQALAATLAFRRRSGVGTRATADAVRRDGVGDWWCGTFAGRTETGCPVTYACHAFLAPPACGLTAWWSWPQLLAVPLH